eukprot:gene33112-42334_t
MVVLDACTFFDNEGRKVEGRYFNPDHPINHQLRPPSHLPPGDRPTPEQYASYDNWHMGNFNSEDTGWSDEEGLSDAAWEGNYRGPHSPRVDLRIPEPTRHENILLELKILETRYQANREGTERLQERVDRSSIELGRMRAVLGIIFDTQMRLAHSLLPLLRSDLDVLYCFDVDGDYELCLRPDLGEEDLLCASTMSSDERAKRRAKSYARRMTSGGNMCRSSTFSVEKNEGSSDEKENCSRSGPRFSPPSGGDGDGTTIASDRGRGTILT